MFNFSARSFNVRSRERQTQSMVTLALVFDSGVNEGRKQCNVSAININNGTFVAVEGDVVEIVYVFSRSLQPHITDSVLPLNAACHSITQSQRLIAKAHTANASPKPAMSQCATPAPKSVALLHFLKNRRCAHS